MTAKLFYWPFQSFVPALVLLALAVAVWISTIAVESEVEKAAREALWASRGEIVGSFDRKRCRTEAEDDALIVRCLPE